MKVLHATLLVVLLHSSITADAFHHQSNIRPFRSGPSSLTSPPTDESPLSSTTSALSVSASTTKSSSESDFSAFADSLEDEVFDGSSLMSGGRSSSSSTAGVKPWQAKLEELLDPMTNNAERQILLSDLLTSNEEIRTSVMDALTSRRLDPLLTPTQKKLQEGTRAVVRQLANDILPQITRTAASATSRVGPPSPLGSSSFSTKSGGNGRASSSSSTMPSFMPPSPSDLESIGNRLFSVVSNQIQKNLENLQEDLTDPLNKIPQRLSKQTEDVLQEARNVFLETPEGLEEPPYTVLESCDLYEIRDYDGYSVASTAMAGGGVSGSASMEGVGAGQAFNVLASYIFGANDESKTMSMTTPVTTTSSGEMRFYLAPSPSGTFPRPIQSGSSRNNNNDMSSKRPMDGTDTVELVDIPPARLAARKFTGFVTDGEVARQKDVLLQALEMDGVELDVAHGAIVPHVVFQYNPPYTLPMVRRNEIAVPVRTVIDDTMDGSYSSSQSLKEEWNVDYVDEDDSLLENEANNVNGLNDLSPSD